MDLIQHCQAGDPNAFALLFEQYKNLVYRTALLMLNDHQEAEDVLQEVFLRVHHSLPTYQPEKGAFTTWLHKITVNYCLNLRRRGLFNLIPLDKAPWTAARLKQPSAEEQIDQDGIGSSLLKLSPKLRAVIVLHFYWGMTYAEIAQVLEIPIGTVQSRFNQALKNIRHSMKIDSSGDLIASQEEEISS